MRSRINLKELKGNTPTKAWDAAKLFVFFLIVFGVFAHTIGDNENSRLDTTIAIVEDKQFSIDRIHNNTGDKAYINDRYYSDKAPLPSFAAVPSYLLVNKVFPEPMYDDFYLENYRRSHTPKMEWARFASTVSVSAFSGALTVSIIYLILLEIGLKRLESIAIGVVSGTGTLIFPYSTTFHGTMLGTVLMMISLFIWLRNDLTSKRTLLAISSLIGLGVASSYLIAVPGGILLAAISLNDIRNYKRHVYLFSGLILGLAPLLMYNFAITGNPLEVTALNHVYSSEENIDTIFEEAEREQYEYDENAVDNTATLKIAVSQLIRSLVAPVNGLFLYSPILIFGLIGLRRLKNRNRDLFWIISTSFPILLILVSFRDIWSIRAFYGPRYLLPVSTLLIIPLALEIKQSGKIRKGLIYASGVFSSYIMFSSTQNWLGSGWVYSGPGGEYFEGITSFSIYENRLRDYLLTSPAEAGQSPILSYLTDTVSSFHMVHSPYPNFEFVLGVFNEQLILFDIRFLSAILIVTAGYLMFKNEIKYPDYPVNHLLFLAVIISLVGFGLTSTSSHMHDWYSQFDHEQEQWGKENPTYYFEEDGETKIIEIGARSYTERGVELLINGKKLGDYQISPQGNEIVEEIDTKDGINKLELRSSKCDVIGRISENEDTRCVTLGLTSLNTTLIDYDSTRLVNMPEDSRDYNRIDNSSKMFLHKKGEYYLDMNISSDSRTNVEITKDGELIGRSTADSFPMGVKTKNMELAGLEEINFQVNCKDCELYARDIELSPKGQEEKTIHHKFGYNWYRKISHEDVIWSTSNSTIHVYNQNNKTKKVKTQLIARSFNEEREISYWLNDEFIKKQTIYPSGQKPSSQNEITDFYELKAEIQPGYNRLEFKTDNQCKSIGDVIGNDDIRCVIFGIEDISFKKLER